MAEKNNDLISKYERILERKKNLIKPYHDKQNKLQDLAVNEHIAVAVYESEIMLLKEFIEDLMEG